MFGEKLSAFRRRLRAAYLKGWDAAIISPCSRNNPYSREDFNRYWNNGYRDCSAGKPLPDRYRYPWRD